MPLSDQGRQREYRSYSLVLFESILQGPHLFLFVFRIQPAAVCSGNQHVNGLEPPFRSTYPSASHGCLSFLK